MRYIHLPSGTIVNTAEERGMFRIPGDDRTLPIAWLKDPAQVEALELTAITVVDIPPSDQENYMRDNGTLVGAVETFTYTLKSDEQLKAIQVAKIDAEILRDELENPITQRGLAELTVAIAKVLGGLSDAQILALDPGQMARRALEREMRQAARRIARKAITG